MFQSIISNIIDQDQLTQKVSKIPTFHSFTKQPQLIIIIIITLLYYYNYYCMPIHVTTSTTTPSMAIIIHSMVAVIIIILLQWMMDTEFKFVSASTTTASPTAANDGGGSNNGGPARPNILFIISDDLRIDSSVYTPDSFPYETTNMKAFSKDSFVFHNVYANQAICNPSRCSFLTGRRPDNIAVWTFMNSFREYGKRIVTLPEYYKRAGYETISIGKVFHRLLDSGADEKFSWTKVFSDTGYVELDFKCKTTLSCYCQGSNCVDEAVAQKTVQMIKYYDSSKQNRKIPWFIAAGFRRPHVDYVYPAYIDKENAGIPITLPKQKVPNNFNTPYGMPSIAYYACGFNPRATWNNGKVASPYKPISDDDIMDLRRYYFSSVKYVDDKIGDVLNALQSSSFVNNTIVVLTSDHGFSLGENGMYCKQSVVEVATRVPLMIRIPWINQQQKNGTPTYNRKISTIAELIDIFPTLLDVTKLTLPKSIKDRTESALQCLQGKSLLPIMLGNDQSFYNSDKDWAVSQYPRCNMDKWTSGSFWSDSCVNVPNNKIQYMGYSIRVRNYRYTEWRVWKGTQADWTPDGLNATELYDHTNNDGTNDEVSESNNLSSLGEYSSLIKTLSAKLSGVASGKAFPNYDTGCNAYQWNEPTSSTPSTPYPTTRSPTSKINRHPTSTPTKSGFTQSPTANSTESNGYDYNDYS